MVDPSFALMTAALELTWTDEHVIWDELRMFQRASSALQWTHGYYFLFVLYYYFVLNMKYLHFHIQKFDFQCGLKLLDPLVYLKVLLIRVVDLRHLDVFWRHFVFNITMKPLEGLGKYWLEIQWWSSWLKTFLILFTLKCLKMYRIISFLLLLWMVLYVDKWFFCCSNYLLYICVIDRYASSACR